MKGNDGLRDIELAEGEGPQVRVGVRVDVVGKEKLRLVVGVLVEMHNLRGIAGVFIPTTIEDSEHVVGVASVIPCMLRQLIVSRTQTYKTELNAPYEQLVSQSTHRKLA